MRPLIYNEEYIVKRPHCFTHVAVNRNICVHAVSDKR